MNTMEITKFVGGICGTLLIFLLLNFFSDLIYDTHSEVTAYIVDVPDEGGAEVAPEDQVDVAELMASADAVSGEGVFKKCASCHKVDGTDGVGPHLNGVVGREAGSVAGFSYSSGMTGHGTWTPEALFAFLGDPKGVVAGTKMSFAGLKKDQDRADVIAYLQSMQ